MDTFKQFITDQRKIELTEPYLIINVNISPKIYEYLQTLSDIRFVDGEYHKYCGEIKAAINNFINYWADIINECVIEADRLTHTLDKKGLEAMIKETEELQPFKQAEYIKAFGLPENEEEQKILDEMNEQLNLRLDDLKVMAKQVNRFDKQQLVTDFLKEQLQLSVSKKNAAFDYAHSCVAKQAAKYSYRIRISFEEILLRLNNNLKRMRDEYSDELDTLMAELYDANKDRLIASRQYKHRTSDTAEAESVIKDIRDKIERHFEVNPMARLEEEVAYWEKRTADFKHIEDTLRKVETELKRVTEYMERYNEMKTTEYPGRKKTCWQNMGENYRRRKLYLEQTLIDTSKAILTFFAVQGHNRIFYKDNIGPYSIDEYGHQMYFFDHGKHVYHNTCDGKFVEIHDTDKYYYDEVGRYTLDKDGKKVYQIAPCTSTYDLNDDELLVKTTKDCGHSEAPNPKCQMAIKNPNIIELLPAYDPVNIKQTLSPEDTKYLWDSLASILPDALCDTGELRSNNPIYTLANKLMYHKYHKNTIPQLKNKMKEAEKYKADILQKRKEKAIADALAYKAKQVQPRKPEESDDTEARQVLATLAAREHLKNQLMYYENN